MTKKRGNLFSTLKRTSLTYDRPFIEKLKHAYQPTANALSSKVVEIIDEIAADVIESSGLFIS